MSTINPAAKLYDDVVSILKTMTIKYLVKAEEHESFQTRSASEMYLNALNKKDAFFSYIDYQEDEYIEAGVTDEGELIDYMNNQDSVPDAVQEKVLEVRRKRIISQFVERNEYYRILNGLPPLEDTEKDFFYVPEEYCNMYSIPKNLPIHQIEDEMGIFYISVLDGNGYIDQLIKEHPDKKYLQHLGTKRISIEAARKAGNFSILYIDSKNLTESIYREFIRCYEKCREYFLSVCYIHEYSTVIKYYDNFIGLCIFLMTVQQVSARMISNAADREFYDDYSIQLLYETYGVPFNKKIDEITQKQIVQNVNLLVQNKACDKVFMDISSILGFESIKVYEYYLMKERLFDANGRPVILWKKKWDDKLGEYVDVPDYENMYDLHFQRVSIDEKNVHKALMDPTNRVEYLDLTLYDPFWWEDDDDTYHTVWEEEYNKIETKYLGVTIPYRMTEMIFQSIIQFHMIFDKSDELFDVTLYLPKITDKKVSLPDAVILLCVLMCKKYHLAGYLTYAPSQIIHILEILDREVHHDVNQDIEVLKFDFEAFNPEIIDEIRETRIKEEIDKLTDEDIQDIYENSNISGEIEVVDEETLRKEAISLIEYGLDRLKEKDEEIQNQITDENKEKFISKDSNVLLIGVYPEDKLNRVKFVLNSKINEDNYYKYFSVDIDKHWSKESTADTNNPNFGFGNEVVDESDRRFTVTLRVKNNLERTKEIIEKHLIDRSYVTSFIDDEEGGHWHDIDIMPDGSQNLRSFRKLRDVIEDTKNLNEFYDYLVVLSARSLGVTKQEKVDALNNIYKNAKELYYFIAFRMSETNNYMEYYALKKLYDTIFYARETKACFSVRNEKGEMIEPETFKEYLKYKDYELYYFAENVEENLLYLYIDHIIFRLETLLENTGYLYILNDGVSPLQELLVQLITFFKSYTTDMVKLSSVMIMDWKMENTLKFIEHPQYLSKVLGTKSIFHLSYSDLMNKITVKFLVKSLMEMRDAIAIGGGGSNTLIPLSSDLFLTDEKDIWFDLGITVYRVKYKLSLKPEKPGKTVTSGIFLETGEYYDSNYSRNSEYDITPSLLEHLSLLTISPVESGEEDFKKILEKETLIISPNIPEDLSEEEKIEMMNRKNAFYSDMKKRADARHKFITKTDQLESDVTFYDTCSVVNRE